TRPPRSAHHSLMHPRLLRSLVSGLLVFAALPARAETGAVPLRSSPVRLVTGASSARWEQAPAWRSFVARHGRWRAQWNAVTGSPHRAAGAPIPLAGFTSDSVGVDRALRDFVAREHDLFGEPTLETVAIQSVRGIWYARYRQTWRGFPLAFTDWEFRVARGRLMAMGMD